MKYTEWQNIVIELNTADATFDDTLTLTNAKVRLAFNFAQLLIPMLYPKDFSKTTFEYTNIYIQSSGMTTTDSGKTWTIEAITIEQDALNES